MTTLAPTHDLELAGLPKLVDLADKTNLSISLISRIMSGNRFPSANSAEKLAGALGLTVPEFFKLRERVMAAGGMTNIHPVTCSIVDINEPAPG